MNPSEVNDKDAMIATQEAQIANLEAENTKLREENETLKAALAAPERYAGLVQRVFEEEHQRTLDKLKAIRTRSEQPIKLQEVEAFQQFLCGEPEPHLELRIAPTVQPRLSQDQANSVIWYLQEVMHVLSDRWEYCEACGELYDCHRSGWVSEEDDKCYCDNHGPEDAANSEEKQ